MTGKELATARRLSGKSQSEVAAEVGIPRSELSRLEGGYILPTPELEQRLKVAVNWDDSIAFVYSRDNRCERIAI